MKKLVGCICTVVMVAVLLFGGEAFAGGNPSPKSFIIFKRNLTQAVNSGNRKVILSLMSDKFTYASAFDTISKEEALRRADEEKIWPMFKKALKKPLDNFVDSLCPNGCYAVWIKGAHFPVGFIFRKENGEWKWVEVRSE